METRAITYAEAVELLIEWADRRLPVKPGGRHIDFSLEDDCKRLCRWIADDPERALSEVPEALLHHLQARIRFVIAASQTQPNEIIGRVPLDCPDSLVLAALIGRQLAETTLPPEWRIQ